MLMCILLGVIPVAVAFVALVLFGRLAEWCYRPPRTRAKHVVKWGFNLFYLSTFLAASYYTGCMIYFVWRGGQP